MKRLACMLALTCGLLSMPALTAAQTTPPTPPPAPIQAAGPVSLAVTTSSARVAMTAAPGTYPVVTLYNAGAAEAFCLPGDGTVVATVSVYLVSVPPKGFRYFWDSTDTNIACIVTASTATIRVTQGNGAPGIGNGGG